MGRIADIYQKGKSMLGNLGEGEAELEARFLLQEAVGFPDARFHAEPEFMLSEDQERRYFDLIEKRLSGVPTAYLLGRKEFWSLTLKVAPGVLIPRPETELVVERVLAIVRGDGRRSRQERSEGIGLLIGDIGTGSGCIALALAKEFPGAGIVATDISSDALDTARENAEAHGIRNVMFSRGNLFRPLHEEDLQGQFDVIVSNPPYVREDEWETLPVEIRENEPREAFVAGREGMDVIERLVRGAGRFLKPRGYLVLEIGHGERDTVMRLFGEEWGKVECFDDLAGIPRVIVARRR
jgi:release factor glutamine methyltransferase